MTNFRNGRIRYVLEKFRSSPVVAINPTNQISNSAMKRHKSYKKETDLYKTSTGNSYGAILPRSGKYSLNEKDLWSGNQ